MFVVKCVCLCVCISIFPFATLTAVELFIPIYYSLICLDNQSCNPQNFSVKFHHTTKPDIRTSAARVTEICFSQCVSTNFAEFNLEMQQTGVSAK